MTHVFKPNIKYNQQANGIRFTNSEYGKPIPLIFGMARCSPHLIYQTNWVFFTKNGQNFYAMAADMLLGYGPCEGVGGMWVGKTYAPSLISSQTFTAPGPATSFTFSISNNTFPLEIVLGVKVNSIPFSVTYN